MSDIKSHRQLWGTEFPAGSDWDARNTAPHVPPEKAGRWSVRREAERFVVIFHYFKDGSESLLAEYPTTEEGELDAKLFALTTERK